MGTKFEVTNTGLVKFKQNGTEQFVFENGAVTPVSGVEGQSFYRTDTDQLLVHDGVDFKAVLGGSFRIWGETPNETPDGIVTAFTVDNPYVAGTTMVTRDGLVMKLGDDYTESAPQSGQITFAVAPSNGSIILIAYSRVEGSALPIMQKFDIVIGTPKQTYSGSTTVVDLPFAYTPASGSLFVYSAGILMLVGGSNDYVETDNNTITFNTARTVSEVIQFVKIGAANDQSTSGWVDAGSVVQLQSAGDQVQIGDGGVSAPGLSFIGDSNTGIWHSTGDTMNFVTGGTNRWQIDSGGALIQASGNTTGRFFVLDGDAATPALTFANDPNTGIYRSGSDHIAISTNGISQFSVSTANVIANLNIRANAGLRSDMAGGSDLIDLIGTSAGTVNIRLSPSGATSNAARIRGTQNGLDTDINFLTQATTRLTISANGQSLFSDGTLALPSISFLSDPDTGIYRFGAGRLGITSNGVHKWELDNNFTSANGVGDGHIFAGDGSASVPTFSFAGDPNTGIYSVSADVLGFTIAGSQRWSIDATNLQSSTGRIRAGSGTAGLPTYSFDGDGDTGMYFNGANDLRLVVDSLNCLQLSTVGVSVANTPFFVSSGTAAAPAMAFAADNNTGIYRSSSDVLGISAGGTTSLLISQTGITYSIAQEWEIRSISTNDSMATTDHVVLADATSGTVTYSLATASGKDGRVLVVKKTDSSVNTVVVDPNGSETIDGNTTHSLTTQYEAVTLVAHGNNWHII